MSEMSSILVPREDPRTQGKNSHQNADMWLVFHSLAPFVRWGLPVFDGSTAEDGGGRGAHGLTNAERSCRARESHSARTGAARGARVSVGLAFNWWLASAGERGGGRGLFNCLQGMSFFSFIYLTRVITVRPATPISIDATLYIFPHSKKGKGQ